MGQFNVGILTGFLLLKNEQKWWAAIYHPPPLPRKPGGMGEQLSPLIAAKAKERQLAGLKQNQTVRENSREREQQERTDESLAQIAGISSNTIRRARCQYRHFGGVRCSPRKVAIYSPKFGESPIKKTVMFCCSFVVLLIHRPPSSAASIASKSSATTCK